MSKVFRLSRRQLLALGLGGVAATAMAQAPAPIRIGVVLPTRTGGVNPGSPNASNAFAGEAARLGAIMAGDEVSSNAELLGFKVSVLSASAPTAEAATRAAERLVSTEKVFALVGGVGSGQAEAISKVAQARKVVFFNIGNSSDSLRSGNCSRYVFHVEASAAMYLDALGDWFVRAGFRKWYVVQSRSPEGEAQYKRTQKAIEDRHWGADVVGRSVVAPGTPDYSRELAAIAKAKPDVILMLIPAEDQIDFLAQYEEEGLKIPITGYPDGTSQSRDFFYALLRTVPNSGAGHRALLWEPTLDSYGARELNARFHQRFGQPMDPAAWAAYQSIKMLFEAASFGGSTRPKDVVDYLENPATVFDVHKGIGVSFRPWDHQLRQPLYLSKLKAGSATGIELPKKLALASLVGELPAIYKPGTDPIERLDQIGDLKKDTACKMGGF